MDLLTGAAGSPVRLPFVPNSMVMDRLGYNLYFGSSHELMVYNTLSNTLNKTDVSAPGVVLAVSPSNQVLLINDQERQLFYLYSVGGGGSATFGGMGAAAAWTPDSKTLYITDSATLGGAHTDTLYVYNNNTGWTTEALPCSTCAQPPRGATSLAITIPSVGAYLSGAYTNAHTWCPTGTVGDYASMSFYPRSDFVENANRNAVPTDVLAATTDGQHILGAASNSTFIEFYDIGISIPSTSTDGILTPNACTIATDPNTGIESISALSTGPVLKAQGNLDPSKVSASNVNQIIASPASNLAFITYAPDAANSNSAMLPFYIPATSDSPYNLGYVPLTKQAGGAAPTAPVAGAFTPDDSLFFVSTAGDNLIHYISIPDLIHNLANPGNPANPNPDTKQISPNLPACTPVSAGGNDLGCAYSGTDATVPATAIVVKPRSTT